MAGRGLVWSAVVGVLITAAGCGGESSGASSATGGVGAAAAAIGGDGPSSGGASSGGVAAGGSHSVGGSETGGMGVGDPPPECMAPCVWALVAPCRPQGEWECREQTEGTVTVACSPGSDWGYVFDHEAGSVVFVGPDGELCYTIEVDPADSSSVYRDAAGVEVARLSYVDSAAGTISMSCADGSPAVVSAPDAPACDPWVMHCTEGTCD